VIKLDIFSDPICPWCLIGKSRLDAALAAGPGHPFAIEYHPFRLNPDMPRGGNRSQPETRSVGYSYIDGEPHRTWFTQQVSGVGVGLGGSVAMTLGSHPIAEDLRSLGLPKKPLMATWAGKMVMRFGAPEAIPDS